MYTLEHHIPFSSCHYRVQMIIAEPGLHVAQSCRVYRNHAVAHA
jgi:hypothetical protein